MQKLMLIVSVREATRGGGSVGCSIDCHKLSLTYYHHGKI